MHFTLYYRDIKAKELQAVKAWADKNNQWIDGEAFDRKFRAHRDATSGIIDGAGGSEHAVYVEERNGVATYIKANNLCLMKSWLAYFHRLALHAELFPEASCKFVGVLRAPAAWRIEEDDKGYESYVMPVVEQIDVAGEAAQPHEVEAEMRKLGFEQVSGNDYINQATGVIVEDLHRGNVKEAPTGRLIVFDPLIATAWED